MSNLLLNYPKGMFRSRRQSLLVDNKPDISGSNVPAGFTHYWLADDIAGVDGDPIGTWPDGVGSNDATAAGSARPTLRTSAINGKNAVEFDGVNDVLLLTSPVSVQEANGSTMFLVCYVPTATTAVTGLASTGATGRPFHVARFTDGKTYVGSDARYGSVADSTTGWIVYVATVGSGTIGARRNGSDLTLSVVADAGGSSVDEIGRFTSATHYSSGKHAFIGIKTGAPDSEFIAEFEAWAASYYGVP